MVDINLLPHSEYYINHYKNKLLFVFIMMITILFFIIFGCYFIFQDEISRRYHTVVRLQGDIDRLKNRLKYIKLNDYHGLYTIYGNKKTRSIVRLNKYLIKHFIFIEKLFLYHNDAGCLGRLDVRNSVFSAYYYTVYPELCGDLISKDIFSHYLDKIDLKYVKYNSRYHLFECFIKARIKLNKIQS